MQWSSCNNSSPPLHGPMPCKLLTSHTDKLPSLWPLVVCSQGTVGNGNNDSEILPNIPVSVLTGDQKWDCDSNLPFSIKNSNSIKGGTEKLRPLLVFCTLLFHKVPFLSTPYKPVEYVASLITIMTPVIKLIQLNYNQAVPKMLGFIVYIYIFLIMPGYFFAMIPDIIVIFKMVTVITFFSCSDAILFSNVNRGTNDKWLHI